MLEGVASRNNKYRTSGLDRSGQTQECMQMHKQLSDLVVTLSCSLPAGLPKIILILARLKPVKFLCEVFTRIQRSRELDSTCHLFFNIAESKLKNLTVFLAYPAAHQVPA